MESRRVLVLTAQSGAGHHAAAAALVDAAQSAASPLVAVALDALAPRAPQLLPADDLGRGDGGWSGGAPLPATPSLADRLTRLYAPIVVRAPWLWGCIFRATNNELGPSVLPLLGARGVVGRLREVITDLSPAAVMAVHPLLTYPAAEARRQLAPTGALPLLAVVTDLVTVHRLWMCPEIDQFVVGSPYAAEAVLRSGVPPGRVHRLGIPVSPQFGRMNVTAREMRTHLGLDPDQPVILVMGGGEGAGSLEGITAALAGAHKDSQFLVVTGRNERLRRRLGRRTWPAAVRVLGFADTIPQLMTAADVVVTKPGSLTIAEACAVGRPLVLLPPIPGQEDGNVAYVVDAEAGLGTRTAAEAVEAVGFLLHSPGDRWEMGQNAARLGQPHAAARILDLLQGLVLAAESRRT